MSSIQYKASFRPQELKHNAPSLLPSGVQHFIPQESKRNSNSNKSDSSNPVILHLLPSSKAKKRIYGIVK